MCLDLTRVCFQRPRPLHCLSPVLRKLFHVAEKQDQIIHWEVAARIRAVLETRTLLLEFSHFLPPLLLHIIAFHEVRYSSPSILQSWERQLPELLFPVVPKSSAAILHPAWEIDFLQSSARTRNYLFKFHQSAHHIHNFWLLDHLGKLLVIKFIFWVFIVHGCGWCLFYTVFLIANYSRSRLKWL